MPYGNAKISSEAGLAPSDSPAVQVPFVWMARHSLSGEKAYVGAGRVRGAHRRRFSGFAVRSGSAAVAVTRHVSEYWFT